MQGSRWEVRLGGAGGQGLITAGIILAEAAVLAGRNAVQTQSYGPESRGGATRAEVVIADGEIDYPKVTNPDALLVLTAEAYRRYGNRIKEGGLLVADADLVGEIPKGPYRTVRVPITRIARDELKREIVANIVALGVLAALTQVVPVEALERAVLARVPKGSEELNRRALACGEAAGRQALIEGSATA